VLQPVAFDDDCIICKVNVDVEMGMHMIKVLLIHFLYLNKNPLELTNFNESVRDGIPDMKCFIQLYLYSRFILTLVHK